MTDAHVHVHGPLAHWAACRPQHLAVSDGVQSLDFAAVQSAVQVRAAALMAASAPPAILISDALPQRDQLLEFLAVIASGRCAAMGDPAWPEAQREAAAESLLRLPTSTDALFYVGFTSGSSGKPKGFCRSHASWVASFKACNMAFGVAAQQAFFIPGRITHSLFLFGMLHALWNGAACVIQEKFSPGTALRRLAVGDLPAMVAVPSQLLLMLAYARQHGIPPITTLRLILIGGARWPQQHTEALQALFPNADLRVFYGASELSFVAWAAAEPGLPASVVGQPFHGVEWQLRRTGEGADAPAQVWVRSPMAFAGYVGDAQADGSACQRDGEWLSVRDIGALDAQGRLCLLGRLDRMLSVQAKKLFPEEIEQVLESFAGVARASVQTVPDALRGARLVALLALDDASDTAATLRVSDLVRWCRGQLQDHKVPRMFYRAHQWHWTASGKTDHPRLAAALQHEAQWLTRLR